MNMLVRMDTTTTTGRTSIAPRSSKRVHLFCNPHKIVDSRRGRRRRRDPCVCSIIDLPRRAGELSGCCGPTEAVVLVGRTTKTAETTTLTMRRRRRGKKAVRWQERRCTNYGSCCCCYCYSLLLHHCGERRWWWRRRKQTVQMQRQRPPSKARPASYTHTHTNTTHTEKRKKKKQPNSVRDEKSTPCLWLVLRKRNWQLRARHSRCTLTFNTLCCAALAQFTPLLYL